MDTKCLDFPDPARPGGPGEEDVEARFSVFLPYLFSAPRFDCANARRAVGDLLSPALTGNSLERIIKYYLETECAFG